MPRRTQTTQLDPEEVVQAVATLVPYLQAAGVRFSISGGAASLLIRRHHGVAVRATEDIDLVVQPSAQVTAESLSSYLLQAYPRAFVGKELYGTITPALAFTRADGSVKHVEIEIFDVSVWPQRPQYDLDDPANEVTTLCVLGVNTPVFSARWLLREKILTAFERRGSRKEETDLDDAIALLKLVEDNSMDMTNFEDAVRHIYSRCSEDRQRLELKIYCPNVLGESWIWNGSAGVYWRLNENELRYLDDNLRRHKFKWDSTAKVWYLIVGGQRWFLDEQIRDLVLM